MRIILDGMGGDNAPVSVVEGAVLASKEISHEIVIVGQEELINNELKKKNTMSINEEKQFVANNSKVINETQIYKSKDLVASLDLMARLCK